MVKYDGSVNAKMDSRYYCRCCGDRGDVSCEGRKTGFVCVKNSGLCATITFEWNSLYVSSEKKVS